MTYAPTIMGESIFSRLWQVADKAEDLGDIDFSHFELEAMVKSGDYFKALGSTIEALSYRLDKSQPYEIAAMQSIVDELGYIDGHYDLKKKQK